MDIFVGKSVCEGIAFGTINIFKRNMKEAEVRTVYDTLGETERYVRAKNCAVSELEELYKKACLEIGEEEAQIFAIHKMMLEDIDYNESVTGIITRQKLNAEAAVSITSDKLSEMFKKTGDDYMMERANDVRDVSNRVLQILSGVQKGDIKIEDKTIIFADDLVPSETLMLDKSKINAFVTEKGSSTSHTAILARSMNIPAIIGVNFPKSCDGHYVAVDGYTGMVYIDPSTEICEKLAEKKLEKGREAQGLEDLRGKASVTADGKRIKLYANIGSSDDADNALSNDAEGIGLFRSEFLYLGRNDFPDEDVQFEAYKKVAETMKNRAVIIRTLDIGADKQIEYFGLDKEENPALGMRAIRICLSRQDIFKTQLRAILRASAFGDIKIMLPMIISVDEIRKAKVILKQAMAELLAENIPFDEKISLGIMIETPAAVIISDILAKEVDFFSIGTNDLIQYTFAIDRQNESVAEMVNPQHEAILRMIKTVAENGHKNGIWTGICGELACDNELVPKFLKIGIDELSVSPSKILEIRKIIRDSNTGGGV